MTAHVTVEDLILADDLDAAGYGGLADWVKSSSHEEVEKERDGLLRVVGRYADAARDHVDQTRLRDLTLSDRLAALGCDDAATQIRDSDDHDDVALQVMAWRELLEHVKVNAKLAAELLDLFVEADDANRMEVEQEDEQRREAAKVAGAMARASGLIAAEDVALIDEMRASGGPWAEAFEQCASPEDVEKVKRLRRFWLGEREDPEDCS